MDRHSRFLGVVAPGFRSMVWGHVPDVYVPITEQRLIEPEWNYLTDRNSYWINVAGRLRPDMTAAHASAAMNQLYRSIREEELAGLPNQTQKTRDKFVTAATP